MSASDLTEVDTDTLAEAVVAVETVDLSQTDTTPEQLTAVRDTLHLRTRQEGARLQQLDIR